jgi:outer membrane protein TolC
MNTAWTLALFAASMAATSALQAAGPGDAQGPIQISLKRAIEVATSPEGNAAIQIAGEALKQAHERSIEQRAALLPDLESSVSAENRTTNLAAEGVQVDLPIPGFVFPRFVGPFTTFDARATVTQSVFDFSAIKRYQASKLGVGAAKSDTESTAEQVAAQTARAYVAALKSRADLDAAQANITLSEALLQQANHEKEAGTGTGIDITRAKVQLANDRQRLIVAQNARRAAYLQLLRAMGMRLEADIELTGKLEYAPVDAETLEAARKQALAERPDLKAQQQREDNARVTAGAVKMQRLPSVNAFGDYGSLGSGPDSALPTRTYGISLRVPIFDGGRRDAQRAESASQYRAEKVRTNDLKQQIDLDVRLALDDLQSADDQVKVAQEGIGLSQNELAQARRRFEAGVSTGVEVTDAQTRLERARDNQTAALYAYSVAHINLAQALGRVRASLQ